MARRRPWQQAAVYAGAGLVLVGALFPVYWMAVSSVREPRALFTRPSVLPLPFTTLQYGQLFSLTNFPVYFWNSLVVAVATAAVTAAVGCPMAYAIVRYRVWGARLLIRLMLVAYMVPALLLAIPLYTVMVRVGLDDTLTSLCLSHLTLTLPLAVWLMYGFFKTVPVAVEEAALVEGASRAQAFRHVVLPMARPGVLTVAIFSFILSWTDYIYALVLTSSDGKKVVSLGLAAMYGAYDLRWGELMAGSAVISVPMLVLFSLVTRHFIRGLTMGAVRG
jgi:multiple sugar transport system permease protein